MFYRPSTTNKQLKSYKVVSCPLVSHVLFLATMMMIFMTLYSEGKPNDIIWKQRKRNVEVGSSLTLHEREFKSSSVKVQIDCSRDSTMIRLNFTKPFSGIIGAGNLDSSKCRIEGNGGSIYELRIAHNETMCDTHWDSSSNSITNTLFIRFHQSLETGNDLAKNVMCRLKVGELVVGRRPLKGSEDEQKPSKLKGVPTRAPK